MKIIAVANQKGGCGKTTTAINLAASLGKKQQRVLLLDLDPQGHASLGFGVYSDDARDLYDVFTGEASLEDIIVPDAYAGVDVAPATMMLAAAEHLPIRSDERDRQLEIHLAGIRSRYDYAIIDCPPSMGLLSLNALTAADLVLIPIEMSLFGLNGIDHMYETIARLSERQGHGIPIRVVPTLVDSRTRLCRQFLHEVGERFADDVSSVMVQFTVRLKEAVRQGVPIIAYDPTSTAAVQYLRLADELMSALPDRPPADAEQSTAARLTAMKRAFEEARTRLHEGDARQHVVLRLFGCAGKKVQIAGDFNGWTPDRDVITRIVGEDVEKILTLAPGEYLYRYIVDGVWQEDPSNPEQMPNDSGGFNSVLQVEEQHEEMDA